MAFEQFPGLPDKVKTGLPVHHENIVIPAWQWVAKHTKARPTLVSEAWLFCWYQGLSLDHLQRLLQLWLAWTHACSQ